MVTDGFDRRTLVKMEVALERACLRLPTGSEKHYVRRIIARKIIECAIRGDVSLIQLTEAGYGAATQLTGSAQWKKVDPLPKLNDWVRGANEKPVTPPSDQREFLDDDTGLAIRKSALSL